MLNEENKHEWKSVKHVFKKYRENELYLANDELPSVTDNFQLVMVFSNSDVKLKEKFTVDREDAKSYNHKVIECINRLAERERKIIILTYAEEYTPPWKICEQVVVGRTLFYGIKARAIGKLYVLFQVRGLISENISQASPPKVRTKHEPNYAF